MARQIKVFMSGKSTETTEEREARIAARRKEQVEIEERLARLREEELANQADLTPSARTGPVLLVPYNDRIIIRPVGRDKTYKGTRIIVPEEAQDRPTRGIVVAVGPGTLLNDGTREPVMAKVGDEVYFGKYAGTEFKLDGVPHLIIRESDLICAIREVPEASGELHFGTVESGIIELASDL